MDRVGFEPTISAMPMPYPTGLDDRPPSLKIKLNSLLIFLRNNIIILNSKN